MKVIIEDTHADNSNKRKGYSEDEQDQSDIHDTMQLIIRALLAYGYEREAIADWFMEFAYEHQKAIKEHQDKEDK